MWPPTLSRAALIEAPEGHAYLEPFSLRYSTLGSFSLESSRPENYPRLEAGAGPHPPCLRSKTAFQLDHLRNGAKAGGGLERKASCLNAQLPECPIA